MRWLLAALLLAGAVFAGMAAGRLLPETPAPAMRFVAPQPTIEWQLPLSEAPESPPTEKGVREWARLVHLTSRNHFERSDKNAKLVATIGDECQLWLFDPEAVDGEWDFLVRAGGVQTQYMVTNVAGHQVRGKYRAQRRVQPSSDGALGVLLLRPAYLSDPARATVRGELRYPIDGPRRDLRRALGNPNGRVLVVENRTGGGVIVILSIGSLDGVAVGDEYRLARGSDFVGFARITRTYKDKSVGEFDTAHPGSAAPPLEEDRCYVR